MIMEEIWKSVKGFDKYEISNLGNIRNKTTHAPMSKYKHSFGFTVSFYKDGKQYYRRLSRLIAEAFVENPNNYHYLKHRNGDVYDNSIDNLAWTTMTCKRTFI